ncbi:MAG: hypothetical protein ACOY93_14720 [Bacillota bacterium]
MNQVLWGSVLFSSLVGSASILVSMYILLPAMGLPRLDFAAVTGGWIGVTGRYARVVGAGVFVAGGIAWGLLYALVWPWHSLLGGLAFSLIPFGISLMAILPELNRFHILVYPVPGFLWLKLGGPQAVVANLVQHLIFGLCLGRFYQ